MNWIPRRRPGQYTGSSKYETKMTPASPVSKRLSEQMAPEIQELIYQPRLDYEIDNSFAHIADLNEAHVIMLVAQGIVSPSIGSKLARALLDLESIGVDSIGRNAALEDAHFNFEAKLIEMTGPEAGGRIHIGRSRNDMGATVDRMRARQYCIEISNRLNVLRSGALEQTERHIKVVMPGYTHLQAAQPITLGFYCLGIAQALARDFTRLKNSYATTNHSPMGAAAFAGTSFPIDRAMVADLLGFSGLVEHALDAVASRDFLVELVSACAGLGITWSRLAQDLYAWSTDEFRLLEFPDRIAGASSIMPQKKNHVVLEYLKATSAQNIGDIVSMLATMRGTHFTNSIDGVRVSMKGGWQALETTLGSLVLANLVLRSFKPLPAVMLDRIRNSFATITSLVEFLVQKCDVSFRDAHHIGGVVVRIALERKLSVDDIGSELIEEAAEEILGRRLHCHSLDIAGVMEPRRSVEDRRSAGGPSSAEVARLLEAARHELARDSADVKALDESLLGARLRLKKEIATLAGA